MDKEALQIAVEKIEYYKSLRTMKEIEEIPVDILRALYLDKIEDNQADLTSVYLKGVDYEKSKWRDKIIAKKEHIEDILYRTPVYEFRDEYKEKLRHEKKVLLKLLEEE